VRRAVNGRAKIVRVEADHNQQERARHPEAFALARRELPSYVVQQRWYPAKDAQPPELSLDTRIPLPKTDPDTVLAVWRVSVKDREGFGLFIPLTVMSGEKRDAMDVPAIAELRNGDLLIDAVESDAFIKDLVRLILQGSRSDELLAVCTDQIDCLREVPESQWRIKRSTVDQSNTSIRVADRSILKIIRKVAPGVHPELEMARFLTQIAHFGGTPALLGWINLGDTTVAILQEFVANDGDGWTWIRTYLQAGAAEREKARRWLARLGRRTAELHTALNTIHPDAAFKAETAEKEDWQGWSREVASMAERARDALRTNRSKLDPEAKQLVEQFHEHVGGLQEWLASFESSPSTWLKTRHHGDFHLGQVLVRGDDAVIVDFEGEPLRSLSERRAKHVPLRDVAGMLRSNQYASASVHRELPLGLPPEQCSIEADRLRRWAADASRDFTDNYFQCLQENTPRPIDAASAKRIVQFFLIEKALYEVLYELSNRPYWTAIPLQSVVRQISDLKLLFREDESPGRRAPIECRSGPRNILREAFAFDFGRRNIPRYRWRCDLRTATSLARRKCPA
jgi:trehalose synthase-fused probable maltokinase